MLHYKLEAEGDRCGGLIVVLARLRPGGQLAPKDPLLRRPVSLESANSASQRA
jgi:hypothetical protein